MSGMVERMREYSQWTDGVADPRTKDWLLISSPVPTCGLVGLYLALVYFGPRFMATRNPLELKVPMLVYNFCLVLLSGYMFVEFFASTVLNPKFNKLCNPVDYTDDPLAARLAGACWWFFFSKIIEFLDTFIFILRKKNNQVSFLHVYHHATMPMLWWIGVRWVAGGNSYFSAMINCLIHVLMYSYYFLAALGPRIQPYLWWKRYLTSLQLAQFFSALVHAVIVMYTDCGFPRGYVYALIAYLLSHIILFSNFYRKTYGKGKKAKKVAANGSNDVADTPRKNGRYNLRERPPKTPYKE